MLGMHKRQVAWLDGKPNNVLCSGSLGSPSLRITLCDFAASYHFADGRIVRSDTCQTVMLVCFAACPPPALSLIFEAMLAAVKR